MVPGGMTTTPQIYGIMERIRELNPGMKLGPRYPSFLARMNERIESALLRICLDREHEQPPMLKVDTINKGVAEVQSEVYRRMPTGQARYKEGQYLVTHNINNRNYPPVTPSPLGRQKRSGNQVPRMWGCSRRPLQDETTTTGGT